MRTVATASVLLCPFALSAEAEQVFDTWLEIPGVRMLVIDHAVYDLWVARPEEFQRVLRRGLRSIARCR